MTTKFDLDKMFKEPEFTPEQQGHVDTIRSAGKVLARIILDNSPPNWYQENAIDEVRRAVSSAISAITKLN